ncbi:hypothetical protein [Roseateles sp.]|uniref:hypothetical protein n=1 Tax=Roseateles sp. TaxID=1971397 RepID=UPI003BAB04BF
MTMQAMSWSTLRALSVNRAIHSASVWALVVPVTAKLMEHAQDVVTVEVLGHRLPLHLALPFSWKVLFVVAVVFMLANLVVAARCPKLLGETKSYREFSQQQRTAYELLQVFEAMPASAQQRFDVNQQLSNLLRATTNHRLRRDTVRREQVAADDDALPTIYEYARQYLDQTHPAMRWIASLLYMSGFIGFALLLAQNVCFVAAHW